MPGRPAPQLTRHVGGHATEAITDGHALGGVAPLAGVGRGGDGGVVRGRVVLAGTVGGRRRVIAFEMSTVAGVAVLQLRSATTGSFGAGVVDALTLAGTAAFPAAPKVSAMTGTSTRRNPIVG
jgi:hypothetical protein